MSLVDFLDSAGWERVSRQETPSRRAWTCSADDLPLSRFARAYLASAVPEIYLHQHQAISEALNGNNVCLATSTASGKSLAFYVAGIEALAANPAARVLAIYPLKALGKEQEERWQAALGAAGMAAEVARIDGQVHMSLRASLLKNARVLIATPDILHAWLLGSLSDKAVLGFLRQLALIVVDEVHSYTGVFGSNSAFLFRRLQHVMSLLGSVPRYICASATIADPVGHLSKLFGVPFTFIGSDADTSPKHRVTIHMVNSPPRADLLSNVTDLLRHLASQGNARYIAFVDSRKQVEHISSILARTQEGVDDTDNDMDDGNASRAFDDLQRLQVLPFRAGYEAHDRDAIQSRLSTGALRGIVSTSALELGMDIGYLDTAVLIGVPDSATSLLQRIGRIGRHAEGTVIVINTGDVLDQAVFAEPDSLLHRPLAEGALYLENPRIQYIHALCLARQGGEHDQVCTALHLLEGDTFASGVNWPEGFLDVCMQERLGTIPIDLQSMKSESGDDPNHTFPLRDVESQFKVELKQGPEQQSLGSVSYGQLLREAYPGAVYYYITRPYRVYNIYINSRNVYVRKEKRYTTRPQCLPTQVFPNLSAGNVFRGRRYGELIVAECAVQIREAVMGFKERRGPNEFLSAYPLDGSQTGVNFKLPRFTRHYFTTGVVLTHPVLVGEKVKCDALASLLYEAFLMLVPFERQDIHFANDRHRLQQGPVAAGSAFLAVFDQVYGSLRLSGRLMEGAILRDTLYRVAELCDQQATLLPNGETHEAIRTLAAAVHVQGMDVSFDANSIAAMTADCVRVILPGSKGLDLNRNNEEFAVSAVFYRPGGLAYRGKLATNPDPTAQYIVPIAALAEIPGESRMGYYNSETGEVEETF